MEEREGGPNRSGRLARRAKIIRRQTIAVVWCAGIMDDVEGVPGTENIADYWTKHHPASHHREMRPIVLNSKKTVLKKRVTLSEKAVGSGSLHPRGCVDSRSDQGTYADILIGQSKEPLAKSRGLLANSGNAATMATKQRPF